MTPQNIDKAFRLFLQDNICFDLASELQLQNIKGVRNNAGSFCMAVIIELQGLMEMIEDYLKTGAVSREIEHGFKKD